MNRDEFNDYVKLLSRRIYQYAFRIVNNREEAEDAVQEVFIRLWKMGDKLKEYDSIEALATTVTRNYCYDQARKRKTDRISQNPEEYRNLTSPTPHDILEQDESAEIIKRTIDKLPDTYRDVLKMRDIEGLEYEEISGRTGQTVNNLRVILSRARSMLRDEYKKIL